MRMKENPKGLSSSSRPRRTARGSVSVRVGESVPTCMMRFRARNTHGSLSTVQYSTVYKRSYPEVVPDIMSENI